MSVLHEPGWRFERRREWLATAVVLSVGAHLLFGLWRLRAPPPSASLPTVPSESASATSKLHHSTPLTLFEVRAAPQPLHVPPPLGKEVIDLPRPAVQRRPRETPYVSEFDSTVAHETRDRKIGNGAAPIIGSLSRPDTPENAVRRHGHREQSEAPAPVLPTSEGVPLPPATNTVTVGESGPQALPNSDDPNTGGGAEDRPPVPDGDQLALNTQRWYGAAYLSRVKRAIRHQWTPPDEYVEDDPIADQPERMSQLHITIDRAGALVACTLTRSSGDQRLDDAALDAVAQAAPFSKPPPGVAGANGLIQIDYRFNVHLRH